MRTPHVARAVHAALLLTALASGRSTAAQARPDTPVQTRLGRLTGTATSQAGVRAYLGVPFAAPPVGQLRWRAPRPAAAWGGVRAADRFSSSCMQAPPAAFGPWTLEFLLRGPVSEDCLYLNVWTGAAPTERRPVLVYIYGGGFNSGSGDVPVYEGTALAAKGLVVVNMNYRVGALGFLAHPALTAESPDHASGNYGLLDQLAALEWVRDNIAAFGGDPARVTIAGQSAGAMSVYLLSASPRAKGLFHRAIIESGPGALASFGVGGSRNVARPLAEAEQDGVAFAEAKGARSLAELRALGAPAVLASSGRPVRFGPVTDGAFLPEGAIAKPASDVPTISGMNADEGSASPTYAASDKAQARTLGLTGLRRVLEERAATSRSPAFMYYFDRAIPWPERPELGAFHTAEVPYVFGTLGALPRPWTDVDRRLSQTMMGYWVNFATRGDPNGPGLPAWPAFDARGDTVMRLGETVGPVPVGGVR